MLYILYISHTHIIISLVLYDIHILFFIFSLKLLKPVKKI